LQLLKVFNGELVAAEYSTSLESSAFIGFSTSSGKTLVHISKNSFIPAAGNIRWIYNKLNSPWEERIQTALDWVVDGGLINHLIYKSRVDLKKNLYSPDKSVSPPKMNLLPKISLDDLGGVYSVFAIVIATSFIAFLAEKLFSNSK